MAIPAQVKKQSDKVQQLYKDMNPEGDEPILDSDVDDDHSPEPPVTQNEPQQDDPIEALAQKYRTLQGMYNADTGRLRDRVAHLEKLLGDLSKGAPPTQTHTPKQGKEKPKLVTEQDMEEYGDSIEVMRRVNQEELFARDQEISELRESLRALQANIVPQVNNMASKVAQTSEQQFWSELTRFVPEWQSINSDKEFQAWLLQIDPLTGISRQAYLEDAQGQLDAHRVANFFTEWSGIAGRGQVRNEPTKRKTELEMQQAPGKGRNTSTPTNSQTATYSQADIKKFFADVAAGRYKGREQERARIEADIFAANREGRITRT